MSEDVADEVKVFRSSDADDALDTPQSSQQLSECKKEVAFETELEGQNVNPTRTLFADIPTMQIPAAKAPSNFFLPLIIQHRMNMQQQQILSSPGFSSFAQFSPSFPYMMSPNYLQFASTLCNQNPMMPNFLQMKNLPMANVTNNIGNLQLNPMMSQRYQPAESPSTPKRDRIQRSDKKEKNRIKKPCNAFMIFMRENRNAVAKENKCKQSSELNKELGQRWQNLSKEEQEKYFDMAKKEREEHALKYPNWSARDNYAINKKKRRNRRERSYDPSNESNEQKKCRARFGVDNQEKWCKHCRRKKRCLNVQEVEVTSTTNPSTPQFHHASPMPMLFSPVGL